MKVNIKKNILFLIITTFMFIGNLMTNYTINPNDIENKWIFTFGFSIVFFYFVLSNKVRLNREKILILMLWELLIISLFFSKLLHENFQIFEFVLYSLVLPIVFFSNSIKLYKNLFLFSFVISIIPFIYLLKPESIGMGNNNLGILFSIGGIVLLVLLNIKNVDNKFVYFSIILFTTLIYFTRSRTSLLAFLIIAILHYLIIFKSDNNSYLAVIRKLITIFVTLIVIYFSFDYIYNLFFSKWSSTGADITSGRGDFWITTINNGLTMFGNGENYFLIYNVRDAHNAFIQILGDYGLISTFLFIILYIYIFVKSIRLKNLEYISFFVGFFLLSQTENLFFLNSRLIGVHLLFFMYLGCIINDTRTKENEKYSVDKKILYRSDLNWKKGHRV
ncbi:O-antigen ligase family protein [Metabacillus sp. cB07]|uniref:O-antigen ligase family protein n=1 Tax=Metabacillus sp. cB07 TaxID=2806989 RepID=UPI00193A6D3E|nr:O-antigen ligase family protein [Metabacillus sp. cB07]